MRTRRLRLSKDRLTALGTTDLVAVVGGGTLEPGCIQIVSPDHTWQPDCWNDISFERCPTPTLPIEECI